MTALQRRITPYYSVLTYCCFLIYVSWYVSAQRYTLSPPYEKLIPDIITAIFMLLSALYVIFHYNRVS